MHATAVGGAAVVLRNWIPLDSNADFTHDDLVKKLAWRKAV